MEGVPIPVWTTKAFAASWEQPLAKTPFTVDLVYHQKEVRGKEVKITGVLENHLGVDLVDAWLIYADRCYPLPGGLQRGKSGAEPMTIPANPSMDVRDWVNQGPAQAEGAVKRVWSAEPTTVVKQLLFHERYDTSNKVNNYLWRPLDLGWRLDRRAREQRDIAVRGEAILVRTRGVGERPRRAGDGRPCAADEALAG